MYPQGFGRKDEIHRIFVSSELTKKAEDSKTLSLNTYLKSVWKKDVDDSIFADLFWVIEIEISIAAPEAHGLQHDAYVMDPQSFRSNEDGKTPQNWCSEKKQHFYWAAVDGSEIQR